MSRPVHSAIKLLVRLNLTNSSYFGLLSFFGWSFQILFVEYLRAVTGEIVQQAQLSSVLHFLVQCLL